MLLDPALMNRLETISLASVMTMRQGQSGNRKSHQKGSSVEFSDFREYTPGDDFRRVDWNAFARFERLYIKLFMEERELPVTIYLDVSASMGWREKRERALQLAAVMCYLAQRNLDRTTIVFCGENGRRFRVPSGRPGLWQALALLEGWEFGGATTICRDLQAYPPPVGGLSVVISDLFTQDAQDGLRFLMYRRQQVALLHILAQDELRPELSGSLRLLDCEDLAGVKSNTDKQVHITPLLLKKYTETVERFVEGQRAFCHKYGVHYLMVDAGLAIEEIVFKGFYGAGVVQ